ncbi:FAD-dependent monooxygenase [Actinomadura welshii]|uniref:FAD-dependent monooxygenase n=1 Tax=Actinomadura welshii TaxID=3103817 RepID=UPI0003AD5A24|nr:FAD-dependent monooxygenase [Actinomadura madurae]
MLRLNEGRRALVVGAGIGGLAAALALAGKGWDVDVAEIKEENFTVGVGINHPANALRALRRLGLYEAVAEAGYRYRGIRRFAADGRLTAEFVPSDPPDVPFQISMTRADLHAVLTRAVGDLGVRIRLGTTWREIAEGTDGVTVEFSDGSRQAYDLMVGADGIRSQLRSELFGTGHAPVETGYVCWRMAVPRHPDMVLSEYWNVGDAKATVLHLNDDVMYLLVVEPGSMSEMPGRSEKARLLKEKLAPFGGLIAYVRDTITPESEIHVAVLEEVFLPAPWYKGHVVLIGDAAHAVTPHLAQGAGMAMEDAIVLAETLVDTAVPQAFDAFMKRRYDRVKYVQDQAHAILLNEMEPDPVRKAEFAASLGARQQEITARLSAPA